ncbi:MAG: hypothetical protein OEW08_14640, partial [Gammaproteobacteria bacterium]|nr:hypothetical protein [Gammaproteobacteria bacterium]
MTGGINCVNALMRAAVFALTLMTILTVGGKDAYALPAFARQMQTECATCHVQHFSKLNAFGREFKASGYSMTNVKSIEGDGLSIAPNLNATFFMRSQYSQAKGQRGVWAVPQEGAILMGGRLNDNIGGMIEWGGPLLGAKIAMSTPVGGVRIGGTVFTTDALGPSF